MEGHQGEGDGFQPRALEVIREVYDSDNAFEKFESELETALALGYIPYSLNPKKEIIVINDLTCFQD